MGVVGGELRLLTARLCPLVTAVRQFGKHTLVHSEILASSLGLFWSSGRAFKPCVMGPGGDNVDVCPPLQQPEEP